MRRPCGPFLFSPFAYDVHDVFFFILLVRAPLASGTGRFMAFLGLNVSYHSVQNAQGHFYISLFINEFPTFRDKVIFLPCTASGLHNL